MLNSYEFVIKETKVKLLKVRLLTESEDIARKIVLSDPESGVLYSEKTVLYNRQIHPAHLFEEAPDVQSG